MRAFICALLLSAFIQPAQAQNASTAPTYKLEGLASLMSNYIDHGVSQTTNDPAMHGSFWFNWGPQFRMGLFGTNVSYKNSDSHFLLRLNAELKVDFSQNVNMVIGYSDERFFKPAGRDGNVLGLTMNMWGYGVRYELISNYYGSATKATGYSVSKNWDVFQNWKSENLLGYVMSESTVYSNFFYVESYIGQKPGSIYYQVGLTYHSNAGAYDGAANLALVLKASVGF